jgi:regulator of protease activity HflC (stomatin/prohibitin superfamily)
MGCIVAIEQSSRGVLEQFGKFNSVMTPGCHCLWPCCGQSNAGTVSLRIQQLVVKAGTKTKDNVFIDVEVSVQFQVLQDRVYDMFYKLTDPKIQIKSYVEDAVRRIVPRLKVDQVFLSKDEISNQVREQLASEMTAFGMQILRCLVTDLDLDKKVKRAMNEIERQKRLRHAATDKADAHKIAVVQHAEAEAEAKYLSGVGIAEQRLAIVNGLRDSVVSFADQIEGADPREAIQILIVTNYYDAVRDIASNSDNATLFFPHAPSAVNEVSQSLRSFNHLPAHINAKIDEAGAFASALSSSSALPSVLPAAIEASAPSNKHKAKSKTIIVNDDDDNDSDDDDDDL